MTDLSFLRPVFDAPGPFATAHIDVSRTTESAAREVALRWRAVREDLLAAGGAEAVLAHLDPVLAAVPHAPGAAYRLVVANASGVLLDDVLPGPAGRPEGGSWGPLPDVAPLLVHRAGGVPYVLVVTDRLGAEIEVHHVVPGPPPETETVQGERLHVTKVAAGDWAHTQFQRRSENLWQRNAREVAVATERALARSGAELLVVTGDERAREALRDALTPPARERLVEVPGDRRAAGADRTPLEDAVAREVDRRAADHTEAALQAFAQRRAQGTAVDDLAEVCLALTEGRVAVLLLDPPAAGRTTLWCGPDGREVGTSPEAVRAGGPGAARGDLALLRAAVATAASVSVLPEGRRKVPGGVGALLR